MDEDSIFIEKHMGLIIDIAWKKFKGWMIYEEAYKKEELIHEGMMGLLRARDKFDSTLGFQFSTYATRWIWGKMSRYIENQKKLQDKENTLYIQKHNIVLERSNEEREFIDIASVKSDDSSIDLINFIECLDNCENKRYSDICKMLIQGYSQTDISKIINIPIPSVNKRVLKIREIIKEEYLKCDEIKN